MHSIPSCASLTLYATWRKGGKGENLVSLMHFWKVDLVNNCGHITRRDHQKLIIGIVFVHIMYVLYQL
jgi:hypothetical protein